jgi:uncharacterized protein (TIGR02145 family)
MKNKNWIYLVILIGFVLIIILSCNKKDVFKPPMPDKVTDIDGNVYQTVKIGTQVWMVENLKTTRYNNGEYIPNITNPIQWDTTLNGAWCCYNSATYGNLYNWKAAYSGKIAPVGWHLPSKTEWETLINFLGGDSTVAGKLKESGTAHWKSNNGATNQSGFTALPGGFCRYKISVPFFNSIGYNALWWSSSYWNNFINGGSGGWVVGVSVNYSIYKEYPSLGCSIRCIFDYTY